MLNQNYQEPFVAIVIDPIRTISSGKVNIGAFRTYPKARLCYSNRALAHKLNMLGKQKYSDISRLKYSEISGLKYSDISRLIFSDISRKFSDISRLKFSDISRLKCSDISRFGVLGYFA